MGLQNTELKEDEVFGIKQWRLNRFMLKTVGLWPYQKKYIKLGIQITFFFGVYTMLIPQVIKGVEEWGKDFEIVVENITGVFYFHGIIAKYITCCLSESKMKYLYQQITIHWSLFTDEGEQNILRTHAYHGRLLTLGYMAYLYTAGIFFATLPGVMPLVLDAIIPQNVSRQKVLCFYGEYFIDQDVYYYQLLFHTFVVVISTIVLYTTIDTTYACCVQHVVALFNIADYRLKKAFELQDTQDFRSDEIKQKIHNYVLSSIEVHRKSIEFLSTDRFANLLQSIYTLCFFFCTGCTLICISTSTVLIMMSINNYINLARMTFAWLGTFIYLFYNSFPGQQIIDASSNIFNSVYFCGWYNFSLKTQHLLKVMMIRSRIPCVLTAGPLLIMNVENCGLVMKTAMSYCTFIIAVR